MRISRGYERAKAEERDAVATGMSLLTGRFRAVFSNLRVVMSHAVR